MLIKKLNINNFKSFNELELSFRDLNFIIGANASGKSNFVKIFEFIRNIGIHGLESAISIEGGVDLIRNINIGTSEEMKVQITYEPNEDARKIIDITDKPIGAMQKESIYEFVLKFGTRGRSYRILKDILIIKYEFVELNKHKNNRGKIEFKEGNKLGDGELLISVQNQNVKLESKIPDNIHVSIDDLIYSSIAEEVPQPSGTLFLESPFYRLFHYFDMPFKDISIYDFDPRLQKKAVYITGKNELMEDGSNLSVVLSNLFRNGEKKKRFLNLLQDLLPFVDNINIQKFADKSLLYSLKEKYHSGSRYLPATFVSDGTINLSTLIYALYFEKQRLIILEEPERNIHPYLISRVVTMLEEVSEKKQIFITTHNPEVVRYAKIDDLLLITRDDQGYSKITRPIEKEEIKIFLQNNIGIDDLYTQNLLGVSNG